MYRNSPINRPCSIQIQCYLATSLAIGWIHFSFQSKYFERFPTNTPSSYPLTMNLNVSLNFPLSAPNIVSYRSASNQIAQSPFDKDRK